MIFDNYAGTCRATRHLIQQGHQRIALLGENNNQAFILQRRNGYLDALREAGLSDAWLRSVPATRRGGYQATLELLRLPEPPTAIITDCNTHGDGAAMALAHRAFNRRQPRRPGWCTTGCRRTASLRPMSPR